MSDDLSFDTPEEAAFARHLSIVCSVNELPHETRSDLRELFLAQKQALKAKLAEAERDRDTYMAAHDLDKLHLAESASEIERLREALKSFAAMIPSSFFAANGSEVEGYTFALHDRHMSPEMEYSRKPHKPDFTGADLARARAALSTPKESSAVEEGK